MKYKSDVFKSGGVSGVNQNENLLSTVSDVAPVSGSVKPVEPLSGSGIRTWQPSTWPIYSSWDLKLIGILRRIFRESILDEIRNVIEDATQTNGGLEHRGHVIGIALLCALDAISSYGYGARSGDQIPDFIKAHFPSEYHLHAYDIKRLYRNCLVHSWNMFEVSLFPGREPISKSKGTLSMGILSFNDALVSSTEEFLKELETNGNLQRNSFRRYSNLRSTAKP